MTDEVVIHVLLLKKKREYETYDSLVSAVAFVFEVNHRKYMFDDV